MATYIIVDEFIPPHPKKLVFIFTFTLNSAKDNINLDDFLHFQIYYNSFVHFQRVQFFPQMLSVIGGTKHLRLSEVGYLLSSVVPLFIAD